MKNKNLKKTYWLAGICFLMAGEADAQLKNKFANDFKVGVALNQDIFSGRDSLTSSLVKKNFNSITAENVMKAETLCPKEDDYQFEAADEFVDFGIQHQMFVVGHTLVWHNQCPDWFFLRQDGSKKKESEIKSSLEKYIKTVTSRYAGKVHAWDVVNEVIGDDGDYRKTKWVQAFGNGDSLVCLAFQLAGLYAPNAELYYNDFNAWKPKKRDGILGMVRMLRKNGIRIDGIGIQGHWGLNYPDNYLIREAIEAYAAEGLKVMITELDIDVLPLTKEGQIIGTCFFHEQFQEEEFKRFLNPYPGGLPPEIDIQLANRYAELFLLFHELRDKIDRVTLWGIHDGNSWKNDYPIPGRNNYPLLWDRNKNPKSAFRAVMNLE